MYLAQRIMFQIDEMLSHDMLNEYYHLPRKVYEAIHEMSYEDIKRMDASNVDGQDNTNQETDTTSPKLKQTLKIVNLKVALILKWNYMK